MIDTNVLHSYSKLCLDIVLKRKPFDNTMIYSIYSDHNELNDICLDYDSNRVQTSDNLFWELANDILEWVYYADNNDDWKVNLVSHIKSVITNLYITDEELKEIESINLKVDSKPSYEVTLKDIKERESTQLKMFLKTYKKHKKEVDEYYSQNFKHLINYK